MTKENLIKQITQHIPSSKPGTDREWSDGTKWFTDKLKKSGKRELDFCYKELLSMKKEIVVFVK